MNLSEFVLNPFSSAAEFNYIQFTQCVRTAVEALNKVLDEGIPHLPLKEQQEQAQKWRPIGLGIFGLADMLIKMGIKYGSPESISLCEKIGDAMANAAIVRSMELAERDGAFPACDFEAMKESEFFKNHISYIDLTNFKGIRNSQLLTVAPTGSKN